MSVYSASSSSSSSRSQLGPSRRYTKSSWPRRMACLQRLAGTDPVSLRSWSVQRLRGRPGRRLESPPSRDINETLRSETETLIGRKQDIFRDLGMLSKICTVSSVFLNMLQICFIHVCTASAPKNIRLASKFDKFGSDLAEP